ncbi:MAG: glycosyl hydrolase [Brevinematia bacterium]
MSKKFLLVFSILILSGGLFAKVIKVGLGSYVDKKPYGQSGPHLDTPYVTENIKGGVPSNKWFSSVLWSQYSEAMYPLPMTFSCAESGFLIGYPEKDTFKEGDGDIQVVMPHFPEFIITGKEFKPVDARLDKYTDFGVDIVMADGNKKIKATILQGSPYFYFTFENVDIVVNFIEKSKLWYGNENSETLGFTVNNVNFAIFAPTGSKWKNLTSSAYNLITPSGKNYLVIALLPDNKKSTLDFFKKYAFAFPTNTTVEWKYDREKSRIYTKFRVMTELREGKNEKTLMGLLPHHCRNNQNIRPLQYSFDSIRGKIRLIEGNEFLTEYTYHGILPWLPDAGNYDRNRLQKYVNDIYKRKDYIRYGPGVPGVMDPYSLSKNLSRLADLIAVAEQLGNEEAKTDFINAISNTIREYFTASEDKYKQIFYYDTNWGTLIMYQAGFGNNTELNDHHFHYGYFIYGASAIGFRDKNWAKEENYGGMIKLLIKDIANWERDDKRFPYMRYFDLFEGHSWASGGAPTGFSVFGPNQESVTEAINAWVALIMWGEITENEAIRDLGIFLYTTEVNAALEYWYDVYREIFPKEFKNAYCSQVWGGKIVHTTWWTEEYTQTKAINMLPLTGGSLFFSMYPDFVNRNLDELYNRVGARITIWPDIIAMFQAFTDPDKALNIWDETYPVEFGNSPAKTYHWIENLKVLGKIDPAVTADTTFYSVFTKNGKKTYVAYNPHLTNIVVKYSDGKTINVPSLKMVVER